MRLLVVCFSLIALIGDARAAAALELRVREVRTKGTSVMAAIDLDELVPDRLMKIVDDGGVLHLQIETELWESRPVWDRLVYPALVHVFRIARATPAATGISVTDPSGATTTYARLPKTYPAAFELGGADRIVAAARYYVHAVATLGTLADPDIDRVSDAVFGRESDTSSIGAVGRFVFGTMLRLSDYMQSVTAETKGRRVSGDEILRRAPSP